MSTLARPSRTAEAPRQSPAPTKSAAIRWSISRAAAAGARPDLVGGVGPPVVLEWLLQSRQGAGVRGSARLVDGERATELLTLLDGGSGSWLRGGHGLTHIDLPGLLGASFRSTPDGARLVYARTSLLSQWGVPGGRYQVAGGGPDGWACDGLPQESLTKP